MGPENVYNTSFWKDGVWALLLVAGLPGFVLLLVDLIGFIFVLIGFAGGAISGINFAIWAVFCALMFVSGYALVYTFWLHYRNKIIFRQDEMSYVSPSLLFKDIEKKIPYGKIVSVVLGWHVMEKAFPEKIAECRAFFGTIRQITLEVFYEEDGKIKKVVLPIIHKKEYYEEFSRLVKRAGLKAKEVPFAFKRQQ